MKSFNTVIAHKNLDAEYQSSRSREAENRFGV